MLCAMARLRGLQTALTKARQEKQQHDNEKVSKCEQAVMRQLNAVVEKYAEAIDLFDAWKDAAAITKGLDGKSITEQIWLLRLQIKMRTVGCGWLQFETKWGFLSDERQQTMEQFKAMLKDVMVHERTLTRLKKLPTETAPPQLSRRALKRLGTLDADAARVEARSLFNVDLLLAKAEAARARRVTAGISDSVEVQQQEHAPPFDIKLVGKWLEVCWPYKVNGKTAKIWSSGRVVHVADGLTDKTSERAKKILPAGAVLWAWNAEPAFNEQAGEEWLFLVPGKWNRRVQSTAGATTHASWHRRAPRGRRRAPLTAQ
jgi:hypothetical protein